MYHCYCEPQCLTLLILVVILGSNYASLRYLQTNHNANASSPYRWGAIKRGKGNLSCSKVQQGYCLIQMDKRTNAIRCYIMITILLVNIFCHNTFIFICQFDINLDSRCIFQEYIYIYNTYCSWDLKYRKNYICRKFVKLPITSEQQKNLKIMDQISTLLVPIQIVCQHIKH